MVHWPDGLACCRIIDLLDRAGRARMGSPASILPVHEFSVSETYYLRIVFALESAGRTGGALCGHPQGIRNIPWTLQALAWTLPRDLTAHMTEIKSLQKLSRGLCRTYYKNQITLQLVYAR